MKSREEQSRREGRERVRRKQIIQSQSIVFFRSFVGLEGRKVGSLKRRVQSRVRGEIKICTLLWRETHFQVKMHKTHHARTTFGSWDVEKLHAAVARNKF